MKFFDNLFEIKNCNYYGVSGLNPELNCLYVYSNFIKFFKGTIKVNENVPFGCYSPGDSSEVLMYFENYLFLMMSVPTIGDYVLKNSKKTKK